MKKILVCEDDEILATLVSCRMSTENLGEVVNAPDGKAAMSLLSDQNFDLIITDLHMPFCSGLEIASYVRDDLKKSTPIIVLSGEGLESVVLKAFQIGANDYITKPFNPTDLVSKVKKYLNGK